MAHHARTPMLRQWLEVLKEAHDEGNGLACWMWDLDLGVAGDLANCAPATDTPRGHEIHRGLTDDNLVEQRVPHKSHDSTNCHPPKK